MDQAEMSVSQIMRDANIGPFNVIMRKYIAGFSK